VSGRQMLKHSNSILTLVLVHPLDWRTRDNYKQLCFQNGCIVEKYLSRGNMVKHRWNTGENSDFGVCFIGLYPHPCEYAFQTYEFEFEFIFKCKKVHKCQYQIIKSIKYAETIEHLGLEVLTGGHVQQSCKIFLKKVNYRLNKRTIKSNSESLRVKN